MLLSEYRRPANDTALGGHFSASDAQGELVWMVDQYAPLALALNMRWMVVLDLSAEATQRWLYHGIEPIQRVFVQPSGDNPCLDGLLHKYQVFIEAGGKWAKAPWNETNNSMEFGRYPDPYQQAALWVTWANAIISMGGYPSTPSMSPGGEYRDLDFLAIFIDEVNRMDPIIWGHGVWISVHNYPLNHPIDYNEDQCGFRHYQWINDLYLRKIGLQLPVLSTEGGPIIGNRDDARYPEVTPESHASLYRDIALWKPEPWLFNKNAAWLLHNDWGNPTWGAAPLYDQGNPRLTLTIDTLKTTTPAVITEETTTMPLNYQPGRTEAVKRMIIHHTGLTNTGIPTPAAIRSYFESTRNGADPVSAHYIIGVDGEILPYIPVTDTAWHAAGANLDSVGVELCGDGNLHQYSEAQYQSLAQVIREVERECPGFVASTATLQRHSDLTPGKVDPGVLFYFAKLFGYLEVTDMPTPTLTPGGRDWRSWLQPGQPEDPLLAIDNLAGVNQLHDENLRYLKDLIEAAIGGLPVRPQ